MPASTTQADPHVVVRCMRAAAATSAIVQRTRAPLHTSILHRVSPLLGPGSLSLALVHTGGALLAGDSLAIDMCLDPGARLHVSTVGATCIHGPSPHILSAAPSVLHTRYSVAADARLVVLPHAVIPFARATLHAHTDLCLEDGAVCVVGEILAAGRIARNEVFAFREMRSSLTLSMDGRVLAMDRLRLQHCPEVSGDTMSASVAASHPCAALAWGPYTHLATLWLSAPWAGDALAARLHAAIQQLSGGTRTLIGSATHARGAAVLVRLLGHNAESLKSALEQLSVMALCDDRS